MSIFHRLTTFKLLYCLAFVLTCYTVHSQTVHHIPNPAGYTIYQGSPKQDFPINYDGNLIFGIVSSQFVTQLAKYNGDTVAVIANSPFNQLFLRQDVTYPQAVIFNDKLYFTVQNDTTHANKLAQYDNDSITLIAAPKGYTFHPEGSFTIYDGKLYMEYTNDTTLQYYLAAFDGTSISIIPNPSQMGNIVSPAPFVIYKNKLFLYYSTHGQYQYPQLASYDGTSITPIPNPSGIDIAAGNLIVYHDNLYFQGDSLFKGSNLMKYNGTSIEVLPRPDNGSIGDLSANNTYYFPWTPFIDSVHNQLCFQYTDASQKVHLASYNDTTIIVIPNPTSTGIGQSYPAIFPIEFNNKMYVLYQSNLAEYTGSSLSVIPNPTGTRISQQSSIVYGKNLYSQLLRPIEMGKLDGASVTMVPNTQIYEAFPIIYSGKFFGYYYDSVRKVDGLGYLDTLSLLAVKKLSLTAQLQNNNAVLHWQTENDGNNAFFVIQRSLDGINFITINKLPVKSNSAPTNNYTYTDETVSRIGVTNLFYRLQSVDKNGINSYSDIVFVHLTKPQQSFFVSPNPAKDFIKIVASNNLSNAVVRITDLGGKTLCLTKCDFVAGQSVKIASSKFPAEMLLVTIMSDSFYEQFKVIKE